jgi:prepilin-type N-terminal cleavage/methylation domain-containing protein
MTHAWRRDETTRIRRGAPRGGFTLIEVLVATLVVSVAVVAAVTMQVVALRSLRSALEHAAATHLAADLAERLLAMPSSAAAHSCGPCDAAQAALAPSTQLTDWLGLLESSLPAARASVAADSAGSAPPRHVRITLDWGNPASRHELTAPLQDAAP